MKQNHSNWITLACVLVVMMFTLSLSAPRGTARATTPAPQDRHEGFEDMHRAQKILQDARAVLAGAPGEYGGHRDKAIKKVDEALHEVHEAIEHH
ncbi:MAG TPA: hypothetical protein VEX69_10035 [Candidatus Limnocylindria bacterium]|nr:hypothetical protein [Candidatus Limnocylindria bacterium]